MISPSPDDPTIGASDASVREVAMVFDFNGVVIDDEPLHYQAFQRVLRTAGLSMSPALYRSFLGLDDRSTFSALLSHLSRTMGSEAGPSLGPADLDDWLARKQAIYTELLEGPPNRAAGRRSAHLFPAARDLIRSLRLAGVPLALVSGARRVEIDLALAAGELSDCFDVIVAAEDVSACKPDPAGYRLAFQRLRAFAPQLVVGVAIEDAPAGIAAARAAGLYSIGVTTSCPPGELRGADRIVHSLKEIDPRSPLPGLWTVPELSHTAARVAAGARHCQHHEETT